MVIRYETNCHETIGPLEKLLKNTIEYSTVPSFLFHSREFATDEDNERAEGPVCCTPPFGDLWRVDLRKILFWLAGNEWRTFVTCYPRGRSGGNGVVRIHTCAPLTCEPVFSPYIYVGFGSACLRVLFFGSPIMFRVSLLNRFLPLAP